MKNKLRYIEERIEIYTDAKHTFYSGLFFGIGATVIGLFLLRLGFIDNSSLLKLVGVIFLVIAFLFLRYIPQNFRDMNTDAGEVIFSSDHSGISIMPFGSNKLGFFTWNEISRISLCNAFSIVRLDDPVNEEGRYHDDTMVVYFSQSDAVQKKLETLTVSFVKNFWQSPQGSLYAVADLPKNSLPEVSKEIEKQSSGECKPTPYTRIIFNYAKNTETSQPV